jgi:hypothetical protein
MAAPQARDSVLSTYFGPFAVSACELLPSIEAATRKQTYTFMNLEAYNALVRQQPERAQAIYWREMVSVA